MNECVGTALRNALTQQTSQLTVRMLGFVPQPNLQILATLHAEIKQGKFATADWFPRRNLPT
jgi:hypothetical protein